ncbi:MAG TPA: carboxymuconolactone decarboxylase family protein [Acidimicrobiia bacterium]|jgi:alkylhydroperoxidase family enzyme|nr:carboxymuconolactone decarboxylase family protein [Acidimicrobiia bacterium]
MSDHPDRPRILPVTDAELDATSRDLLAGDGLRLNIFRTLVRHPGLFRKWLPFGGKLLAGGKLSPRDRELVILRAAFRCRARYEWAQHVAIARTAGLADDEIARVAAGPDAAGWTAEDAALLRAVDELHDHDVIGDATWSALASRFDTRQLIEIPMLAGHYAMLAGVLNSLGVQPESTDLPALGEV